RALPGDTLLVEYFRIGARLVAFLVGRDRLEVVPVALVPRVQHALRLLQFQLSWARPGAGDDSPSAPHSSARSTQAHLAALYQDPVAPLRARLDAAHLVLLPPDLLHY